MNDTQLKRIADALEEILRLVKLDQEKMEKRFQEPETDELSKAWKYEPNEDGFMGSENRIESEN